MFNKYTQLTPGQRVKIARTNANLTQSELGVFINVKKSAIANIENGINALSWAYAHILCEPLKVTAEWLLTGKSEESLDISKKDQSISDVSVPLSEDFIELPYISIPARASFLDMFQDERNYGAFETFRVYQLEPELQKKGAIIIEVNGDSMEPQLKDKAKVLAVPVPP